IPSSCCGLFGLKPSRGRTPPGPHASENWTGMAIEHVLTRSVRDSAAMLDATHGPIVGAPYHVREPERPFLDEVGADPGRLKIGFHAEPAFPVTVHRDCKGAVEDAAALCRELGHDVEAVDPEHPRDAIADAFMKVVSCNIAAEIAHAETRLGRESEPGDWQPTTLLSAMLGRSISGADFVIARHRLEDETRRLAERFSDYDVILTPTLGKPPIVLGALHAKGIEAGIQNLVVQTKLKQLTLLPGALDAAVQRVYGFIPFTPVANFAGLPSMSVPLHWNGEGLPIGTMFTAALGDEAVLLRLAAQLETARPWKNKRPPMFQ
ncbi:MAG: amidase family protein, partial [Myxococcota bacterium]